MSRYGQLAAGTQSAIAQLEAALAFSRELIRASNTFSLQFAAPDIGVIDLPAETYDEADIHTLQTTAALYLAAELESAHLLPVVELLAGLARSGAIRLPRDEATEQLFQFWQRRNERFSPQERGAFFARLFGGASTPRLAMEENFNESFELLMIDFVDALYSLDVSLPPGLQARSEIVLKSAGQRLAQNLLPRSGGIATYAARDIISATQEALNILKQPTIQSTLGARSVWGVIQQATQRYMQLEVDIRSHIQRGSAGLQLLSWLAEKYPQMHATATTPIVSETDETIVQAAGVWLQASLNIEERKRPSSDGNVG